MSRIVINTWGSFGDVYPYVGLGLALRSRGHQPILAVPGIYRETVEREGLDFAAVGPEIDIEDRALARRVMHATGGPETLFREILVPNIARAHGDLLAVTAGADLLISHPAALAAPIVADERGMPWASSVLAPMSFFSATDPIVPPPAPWVHMALGRSAALSRGFLWLTRALTARWAAPVTALRASRGLPPAGNPVMEGQHSPHLVLALFSSLLASPQADWPANVRVTGPVLYNAADRIPLPEDLLDFLDRGEPPIVFTLGTSAVWAAGRFYEVSAAAAARLGRRAVLLVGRNPENKPVSASRDVRVIEFAPHAPLFARAAAIVHQGGAGTLHQTLASGKPMLIVPHSHDQPDNARRAEALGVSRTLYPSRYREAVLERELRAMLEGVRIRERAAQLGPLVRAEDGAARGADAIDALLV